MPEITVPTLAGYAFQGYFDAISGGTKYYNADGTSAKNWDKTSATTLYAQWTCVDPTNINISGEYIRFPGETIELTVSGDNIAADASYVWKKGDQVITGQTTETLTIANATIANAGNYLCEVTNGTCSESGDFTIKMYSLRGLIDWHTDLVFVKESANIASYSIELNGNSSYEFKVFDGGAYYGNTGAEPTMTSTNCTNWPMQQNSGNNVTLKTVVSGIYTFKLDYSDSSNPTISVIYPQKKMVYLNPGVWDVDNAKFALHAWGSIEQDVLMTKIDDCNGRNIYVAEIDANNSNIIFIRGNTSYDISNPWHNVWNQTGDLVVENEQYSVGKEWDFSQSAWTAFTPNYSVTFNANGHGTAPADQCVAEGGEVTTPAEPTTTGYTFGGWYKEVGCTNAWDFAVDVVTSDITLYAKWTINTHTLTWNVNGGNALTGTYTNGTLEYGSTITKPADPTRTGYTFLGWHDGTNIVTPATTMPDDNLTYTAQWQINSYTVTWNPDGGKWGSSTDNKVDTYEYGASINQPANPTREGYSFMGWSPTPKATMPDNNLTYTAQWAPQYTITWIVNGTPLEPTVSNSFTNSVTSGGEIQYLPNAPDAPVACEGKVFVGWTDSEIAEETDTRPQNLYKETNDFPAVTKNETYYAVWADEMQEGGITEVTDELNLRWTGVSGTSYASWSDKQKTSTAVYAGNNAGGNSSIQLRSSTTDGSTIHSGIVTSTSGGKATKIQIGWQSNTSGGRTLDVYGKNTPYTSADDLYNDETKGELLGSIVYTTSTTLKISGDYEYIGLRSKSGAMYLSAIYITWTTGTPPTYSAYTTTCDDTKAIVNYNLNGGTGAECEEMKVTKGESFTLCAQTPERDHYDFDGWSDGTTSYAAGASVSVEESTTFYAKWTPKTYTITLNPNGGLLNHEEENIQIAFVYGSEVNPLTDYYETIEREGYDFTGWYSAQSGGSPWVNAETELDLVLYARWAQLYSVVYEVNGNTYVNQQYQYTNGETIVLPEAPSAANYACDGYLFAGWSATPQAAETSSCPTLVENDAVVSENMHLYAVWKKATTTGAGEIIFYESFNEYASPGGNDQNFNTASSTADNTISKSDEKGWSGTKVYGAKACIKLGGSDDKGSATTPALTQLSGTATLSFKAAAWNGTKEKNTLTLSVQGGGNLNKTSVTLTKGAWQDYEVTITGGTSTTRITFEGQNASNNRFFLDEVKVATSGSYNYTTSPNCGPTMVAKEGMWVTSAADQSVMVRVPISLNSFESNVTITGTCANTHFSVATLENVGNGVESLLVTYTPTEHNQTEDASITLTAHEGESVLSTTTFTLKGRSLPETFAVVAMKNAAYYALPANMPEAATYKGLHVNVEDDAVIAAPTTHLYSLKSVHNTRFEEHGTQVRLVGNNEACLWASNAKDGTNIRNWAVLSNAKEAQYEWNLYTEDGDTYTISCAAVTEEGRILRMYGDNLGMYKTGANVFRLMPVNCTEQPMNVQVSSTRVTATIAWTNAAACKVDVYLKSNSSLVNSIASKASPVTITGLTETTEYTFTLTPVDATDCAMNGAFKTSGPDIDIVEWMTDGVVIQVDKDENVNPKVVIKGEVEHNTGSGVMATELFYREFETLDDSKTLEDFKYKPEENLYKLKIDNVAQYSCLNIQVQINDPSTDALLTEQTAQVPILVTTANTTTDELFSDIVKDDLNASKTRCSTCDVVVLNGATLTKAAAETANDVNQVRNVYIYPGAKLIVPENADDYSVNSISFRRVEEEVGSASVETTMNITSSSAAPIYVDVRVNAENWHWFTLPYDCNIADVTWVDGTPAKYGVDWFLSTYDGEKRAATQSGGCWAEFHGDVIKAGVGYIVGIAGYPNKPKVKYELRFPMSKDVLAKEKEDKTVPVYAWGVENDMRPIHKGWNLVGNPYLDFYKKNTLNSFNQGLRLGGEYVLNPSTGYWEDSGEWNGETSNLPYVVVPIDGGWSAYEQVLVSEIDLLPFTAYFVQVGETEHTNGQLCDVRFEATNRGKASIARRAPSEISEDEEPVIVGVKMTNAQGESDKTSLVIDDRYTEDYEMNADFFKWFGDYYRYYTKPVLYTIGTDNEQRAFNALPEVLAAQPVSVGTYTAQNGEYTFSLDRRSDLTRVKEVWLHDATENIHTNLMQGDYTFTAGRTDGSGRFSIAVSLLPKMPTDCVNGSANGVYVSAQQRTLYLHRLPEKARVWVYDAVGKLLVQETTHAYQRAYKLNQAGVYFVRVESQEGTVTLQAIVE